MENSQLSDNSSQNNTASATETKKDGLPPQQDQPIVSPSAEIDDESLKAKDNSQQRKDNGETLGIP